MLIGCLLTLGWCRQLSQSSQSPGRVVSRCSPQVGQVNSEATGGASFRAVCGRRIFAYQSEANRTGLPAVSAAIWSGVNTTGTPHHVSVSSARSFQVPVEFCSWIVVISVSGWPIGIARAV